ncbi:hypothetical protein Hanom_Chr10g00953891 [Helianthus anomalus]
MTTVESTAAAAELLWFGLRFSGELHPPIQSRLELWSILGQLGSSRASVQVRFDFGPVNLSMFGLVRVLVSGQQWFRVNGAFGPVGDADQIACFGSL